MKKLNGNISVELAIVLPIFFLIIFNFFYGGFFFHDYHTANHLASNYCSALAVNLGDKVEEKSMPSIDSYYVDLYRNKLKDSLDKDLMIYKAENIDIDLKYRTGNIIQKSGTSAFGALPNEIDVIVTFTIVRPNGSVPNIARFFCPDYINIQMLSRLEKVY